MRTHNGFAATYAILVAWCLSGPARAADFCEEEGLVSMEAESYTNDTGGWERCTGDSSAGGGYVAALRGRDRGSRIEFPVLFARTGWYRVWLRARCTSDADNDCYVLLDDGFGSCPTDGGWKEVSGLKTDQRSWGWQGTTKSESALSRSVRDRGTWVFVPFPGEHRFALGARSRDFKVDKVLLLHRDRPDANGRPRGEGSPETRWRPVLPDEERSERLRPAASAISQGLVGSALRALESVLKKATDARERRQAEAYAALVNEWIRKRGALVDEHLKAGRAVAAYIESDCLLNALAGHPSQKDVKKQRDAVRASQEFETGMSFFRLRQSVASAPGAVRKAAYVRFAEAHPASYYGRLAKAMADE
jgi:hypothetical protein